MNSELAKIRRKNLQLLSAEIGGQQELAARLEREPAQISHLIGKTPRKGIGPRLARHIEQRLGKPSGWLDVPQWDDGALSIIPREISDFDPEETKALRSAIAQIKQRRHHHNHPC